jgi:phosphate butyryltransferase
MYNFAEIKAALNQQNAGKKSVVAVAAAGDMDVLEAIKIMNDDGFGTAILVGDAKEIEACAKKTGCNLAANKVVDIPNVEESAAVAVALAKEGAADIIMKGLMHTKVYLRAILNKEYGLRTGKMLNAVTAVEMPHYNRMVMATDCGMVVTPTLDDKVQIINNAVTLAHAMGCDVPKVSCLSAVETVNANMPDGFDAAVLCKMNDRGQIKGCIVDGPLSMDLSISEKSVRHKGIDSPVAGKADILLMPNLQAGNIFWKSMTYLAHASSGAVVMGAAKPAVLTSRADSAIAKANSIAMAMLLANYLHE